MSTQIVEFALASLLIELTPGPNMAWLAALAISEGRRAGLAAVAGICAGLAGIGGLAAIGLGSVINTVPYAYDALRYAGAAFLLFLAWEGWRGAAAGEVTAMGMGAAFRRALMTNLLNPKAMTFYIVVLPLFIIPGGGNITAQSFTLVAIYVFVATFVHAMIVIFASFLRPYLVAGPYEQLVRRLLAASLALVAIWFFWGTRR